MSRGRRLALVLAAVLTAAAGPFDRYQLIMWQEHSPAEIEGLKRLGFTATKLRATGGQVDPAELAAHVASGLPWYLENIATDFFAPYHRYTPGKSVTWLFDDAKARRRAAPSDPNVFIREPGLSDPMWQKRIAQRLQELVRAQAQYRPLFYNLADEAGIGDLAAAWDADIGPSSLAAFRAWLQTLYTDLGALNAEWGSAFAGWDAVVPELTDAALARTDSNYASWGDFKAFMDVAFARAVRAGTDALHRADPSALAALEGGQLPGWGGYDYGQLAPALDLMEIYDAGDAVALARAANPDLILLRTSFGAGESGEIWRNVLDGGRGTIVWDEGNSIVEPDGAAKLHGRELAATVAAIRAAGPGLMASRPDPDPVAVLVSQASFRTQWLLDRKPGGARWSERDAAREYEDNAWRAARREALQRLRGLGVVPHLLTTLTASSLDGMRVLVLPHAIALSDGEVMAIEAFAAAGGTVLADTEPGLFDGHSRLRAAPPLKGVARVLEAMLRTGVPPTSGTLDATAELLAAAGATPRAMLRTENGARATGLEARWLRSGQDRLLSLQALTPFAAPVDILVTLPEPATVRALVGATAAQSGSALRVRMDPATPTILAIMR